MNQKHPRQGENGFILPFSVYRRSLDGYLWRLREPDSTDDEAREFYDKGGDVEANARSLKENRAFARHLAAGGTSD